MEREYLKKILNEYSNSRMNTIYSEENYKNETFEVSKRYQKRMKKLLWNEKYFGTHIRLGYAVRRVAVAGVVILSLAAVNVVSAKVFGFDPWKTTVRSLGDMYELHFVKPKEIQEQKLSERIEAVPVYVPEGYKKTEEVAKEGEDVMAVWEKGEGVISYLANVIREDTRVAINSEYDEKRRVSVAGYEAELTRRGEDICLIWNDQQYQNNLIANQITEAELVRVAESMYEKKK